MQSIDVAKEHNLLHLRRPSSEYAILPIGTVLPATSFMDAGGCTVRVPTAVARVAQRTSYGHGSCDEVLPWSLALVRWDLRMW